MDDIKELSFGKLKQILTAKGDSKTRIEKTPFVPDENKKSDLEKAFYNFISPEKFPDKAVLGIDIYRYSNYPTLEQTLLPFLFGLLYNLGVSFCIDCNEYMFQKYTKKQFDKFFISTGDGGFQIFPTPLHALIFAIGFEVGVREYNSYIKYPKLRRLIGALSLRYTITYDKVHSYEKNYYGPSIINNARILAKDSLNRCLIDENTVEWFMLNTKGIENLPYLSLNEIKHLDKFQSYNESKTKGKNLVIQHTIKFPGFPITAIDILKIGEIKAKGRELTIYNLHLQFTCQSFDDSDTDKRTALTITLGNLNTTGIQDT